MSISLPLDNDGFLRRECPNCENQFKWHNGPATEEAESADTPTTYYCPICGLPAGPDAWWTQQQLVYMQEMAQPLVMRQVTEGLSEAFRGNKSMRFEPGREEVNEPPAAMHEPDDMRIVTSPCHDYEPVKVPEEAGSSLYCLICGSPFAV